MNEFFFVYFNLKYNFEVNEFCYLNFSIYVVLFICLLLYVVVI